MANNNEDIKKDETMEDAAEEKDTEEVSEESGTEQTEAADENAESKEPEEDNDTKYLRLMADFQNYKKRVEKEKKDLYSYANEKLVTEMLPVLDNFERALTAAKDKEDPFVKGVEMTYNQMIGALKSLGIEAIDALGQPFDPHFHHAMMHVEDENYGENEIIEVLQTGYMYNDTVLRCSMVKVAN